MVDDNQEQSSNIDASDMALDTKAGAATTGHESEEPPRRRFEDLPPAAQRALKEAEERRQMADAKAGRDRAEELGGRKGPEPTRYGDWEKKGIVSDF